MAAFHTSHFHSVTAITREIEAMGFHEVTTANSQSAMFQRLDDATTVWVYLPEGEAFEALEVEAYWEDSMARDFLLEALRLEKAPNL